MRFGFNMPTFGKLATADNLRAFAERGEAAGFGCFTIPDHIILPRAIASTYPYSDDGSFPRAGTGHWLEQLTAMSYLAAITTTARLLTSVMVVPHRPAVLTAKVIASIDHLSGGRVDLGVGAGWMEEEFKALGAPDYARRGAVTNEFLAAFKELWTAEEPRFAGKWTAFDDVYFAPKPVQQPHPPIWVGGESPAALRRVAKFGDVWFPIGSNPRHPLNTVDRFAEGIAAMRQRVAEEGRDPDSVGLAFWGNWYQEDAERRTVNGERHIYTGSDDDVADDIKRLRDLGVEVQMFNLLRGETGRTLAAIDRFAAEVMPRAEA